MSETITLEQLRKLIKEGRVGNKKKGDKAKAEMEAIIKKVCHKYIVTPEYKFYIERKFKFDWAVLDIEIAIEYEGLMSEKSGHTTVTGYTSNCAKYNLATILGWKVLRYTALNYKDLERDLKQLLE